jgi:hypothetical protein
MGGMGGTESNPDLGNIMSDIKNTSERNVADTTISNTKKQFSELVEWLLCHSSSKK